MAQPYILYRRYYQGKKKGKKRDYSYYVIFKDGQGNRLPGRATGCNTKAEAMKWVTEQVRSGKDGARYTGTFGKYAEKGRWWVWEECNYMRREQSRGKTLSPGYAYACRNSLQKHLLPFFANVKLQKITPQLIEQWLDIMKEKNLSPGSINRCLMVLRIMLKEAFRLELISSVPTARIKPFIYKAGKRDILRPEEIKALFDYERINEIWNNRLNHFALNILSCSTGMRSGECLGLLRKCVHEDYIEVKHSWGLHGLKCPKGKKERIVPLPIITSRYLQMLMENSLYKEESDLVFFSTNRDRPISQTEVIRYFRSALVNIGISKWEQKQRGLCFHGHRHFFNSLCIAKNIPGEKLRKVIGHEDKVMTDNYLHLQAEDLEDIRQVQNDIFNN
jgi:integrase